MTTNLLRSFGLALLEKNLAALITLHSSRLGDHTKAKLLNGICVQQLFYEAVLESLAFSNSCITSCTIGIESLSPSNKKRASLGYCLHHNEILRYTASLCN